MLPVCQSGLAGWFCGPAEPALHAKSSRNVASQAVFLRGFYDSLGKPVVLFCRDGRRQPEGLGSLRLRTALNRQYVTVLLCLFLFIAAVDTIPDPPAINPPKGHSCGITALHVRGPLTTLENEWLVASSSLQGDRPVWSRFQLTLDSRPAAISTLPVVHHAADSSPPLFA